jgi:hypothetical protein
MSWLPANLGAERKKVIWLAGLLLTAVVAYFISSSSDSPPASASAPRTPAERSTPAAVPSMPVIPGARNETAGPALMQRTTRGGAPRGATAGADFRPSMKQPEGTDLSAIDPTLHLDLLAKLRNLPMEGGARSVFKEGTAPTPPAPDPVTIKPGPIVAKAGDPANAEPPKPTGPPPTPPPPPIPLKFYGYANQQKGGPKRAFFLEGEDIFVAGENETVHNRYRIIKIGVNSAVVEDTTDKHQQTLPLVEELSG